MSDTKRRGRIVWLAGAAALVPLAMALPIAPPAAAAPSESFAPPASPMILTRTLRRSLPDGKEVMTRRAYQVQFAQEGEGFRLDGELIDVTVEAPPSLQAIADLERVRPDAGLFPVRLDREGRIVSDSAPQASEPVRRGIAVGVSQIAAAGLAPAEARRAQSFVQQLQSNPARSPWPTDLFRPVAGTRSETRAMPVPDGNAGSVRIDTAAHASGETGLLESFERRVTTELGGDRRVMHELWTLRTP